MKKMIFGLLAIVLLTPYSFAQSNNPYDQLGADVITAANAVLKDYQEGKIKNIDQSTLDYYYKTVLSNYPKIKIDDFTKVLNDVKSATNKSVIDNSGYSDEAKAFLNKSLTSYSITALVDEVKKSKIPENEKQNVLSVLAIDYNLIKPLPANRMINRSSAKGPNINFSINDSDLSSPTDAKGAAGVLWGGIGFITGNAICGLPCGIIGGLIGLVLGSANGSNTTVHATGGYQPHL